jgi:AraC-like DNA-binding protein
MLTICDKSADGAIKVHDSRQRTRSTRHFDTADDATVRLGPLAALPAIVQQLGRDPDALVASAGFAPAQFEHADNEVSYVAASRLLAHCVALTGCTHLGLLIGQHAEPSSLGVAGFMLRSAPNVRAALHDLETHLDLHDQGGALTLSTQGDTARLSYLIHQRGVEASDQIYDLSITMACKILRNLCGDTWSPSEVLLSHRPPLNLAPYKKVFHAPLRFDAEQSAVAFPTHWLDHPLAGADALLHQHLEREAEALHLRRGQGVAGKLRRLLRTSLPRQTCNASNIASQLGIHQRTLNRRLRAEGTTFRRELEQTRFEVAQQLLSDTTMPLGRIAASLNYADTTAFSRAFRRWSGIAPTAWRKRMTPPE